MRRGLVCLAIMQAVTFAAHAQNIAPDQAAGSVGQTTTVCGTVSSTAFSAVMVGRPTFLNFGGAYPNQAFTVVLWGGERDALGNAVGDPNKLAGQKICVTGTVSNVQGKPEMFLQSASQVKKVPDAGATAPEK